MLAVIFLLYLAPDTVSPLSIIAGMEGTLFLQLSLCVELHAAVYVTQLTSVLIYTCVIINEIRK